MAAFKHLKEGVNEALLKSTREKVEGFLKELFKDGEVAEVDNIYSVCYGGVDITIRVAPWHSEDVLVEVFSYLEADVELTAELMEDLLRKNAIEPFGAFGVTFDNTIVYSYSLAGANIDMNEFQAAVLTVATVADQYES